ncbi:MAG: MoxR family ATPase [Planctomycetota bacterium]
MHTVVNPPRSEGPSDLAVVEQIRTELNRSLRGKADVVEMVLACLFARGHLLLEDVPGLGKTTLAKALAHAVGGRYSRVQCTPDLMPSDVTGFNMLNQKTREFEFSDGPVFADVLLADEINRATPRTQSALFEAMAERQVTIDRQQRLLPETFFVIATQNPVESHGAYPLPEAQLDRFAMKVSIGYPDSESELAMLQDDATMPAADGAGDAVLDPTRLAELQSQAATTTVCEKVQRYLIALAKATREDEHVLLGLSPRALLTWQRVAQARAFLAGRSYVTPDDVQDVATPVLSVRLVGDLADVDGYISESLAKIPTPTFD